MFADSKPGWGWKITSPFSQAISDKEQRRQSAEERPGKGAELSSLVCLQIIIIKQSNLFMVQPAESFPAGKLVPLPATSPTEYLRQPQRSWIPHPTGDPTQLLVGLCETLALGVTEALDEKLGDKSRPSRLLLSLQLPPRLVQFSEIETRWHPRHRSSLPLKWI